MRDCSGLAPVWLRSCPAETPLHDFAQQNLEAIAASLLEGRTWRPVKSAGLRDQVLNTHLNCVKSVWQNVSLGYANVVYDLNVDGGKTWKALIYWYPGNGVYGDFHMTRNARAAWTQLSKTFTPGLGVTGDGDLVLGRFGRLAVVPYA